MKVYSGVAKIPHGMASTDLCPGCAVLEGGAWRGIYSEGVTDALMQAGVNLQTTIGVSAGALTGISYVSGQIGRAPRLNLTYRHDPNYCGLGAFHRDHGITGFSYLFEEMEKAEPLDRKRFDDPARRFVVVATDCLSGQAVYFEKGHCSDFFRAVQASATVPYVSRMVEIDGRPYLDGGCAVKVAYPWALQQGFEKILVVRTRDRKYRKPLKKPAPIIHMKYAKYPQLEEDLNLEAPHYNASLDQLDELEKQGRVFVIAPSQPITIKRFEGDMEKLGALYHLGYDDAQACMADLKAYLRW